MSNRQTVSYLIKRFREVGVRPDTRHGQNFLVDLNLLHLLADTAQLEPRDVALEVGTGTGSLTALLAAKAAAVVTVEISAEMHQLASEELREFDNITLLQMDALKNKNRFQQAVLDTVAQQVHAQPDRRLKLAANLPYNVATPIISNLLLTEIVPWSMTVTIQKELADRITARPNRKDYGALSIWIQSQCDAQLVRVLPPTVFWPQPKVHSAIIHLRLNPKKRAAIPDLRFFHSFLRALFVHRRKFLRSGLVSAFKKELGKSGVDQVVHEMGLKPDARAEQMDVSEILALSQAVRHAVAQSASSAETPSTDAVAGDSD